MNFTDLQVELRSIENQIERLHTEIEKMKPKTEEEKKTDFEAITQLAKQQPMNNFRLASASEAICKQFLSGLSYLLLTEEQDIYERLLYLCRISQGCGLCLTAEELYKAGLEFEYKDMKELCIDLQDYKNSFLVEALILANLFGEASKEILTKIADLAQLLECDKEEIRVIGQVARSRLLEKPELLKQIPRPSKPRWLGKFIEYIPKEWIEEQRIFCEEICGELSKNRLPCGSVVQKGDIILTYKKSENSNRYNLFSEAFMTASSRTGSKKAETKSIITAPCDGIVFYAEEYRDSLLGKNPDRYIAVYVVSFFDEYNSFCEWYRNKQK